MTERGRQYVVESTTATGWKTISNHDSLTAAKRKCLRGWRIRNRRTDRWLYRSPSGDYSQWRKDT